MASVYTSFLQSPGAAQLAPDASLNYITTTTTITEPAAILKHLLANAKQVDKTEEKVLSTIESQDGLCLETQTTLKFKNGGGVYLPGIDENLLDEKVVVFPMTHIVRFTADKKIQQIRLYWDQGTLLKQVEAIGKTGRNWPIRDGKAQIEAVNKSIKAIPSSDSGAAQQAPPGTHRRHQTATKDPHASLNLFAPRNPDEEPAPKTYDGILSPRSSAKPAPRDYGELFASEETVPKGAAGIRSPSPAKAGAQQNYTRNRLHDENAPPNVLSPGGAKKVYDQKYDHFSFGDGEDAPPPKPVGDKRHSKHQSTFSFEDFATPLKHVEKKRPDQVRQWGDDVEEKSPSKPRDIPHRPDHERHWGGETDPPSPPRRNLVHAPRPDAKSHFEITDEIPKETVKAGTTTTRVDNSRRGDDFGAHYTISDESPAVPGGAKKRGTAPRVDQEQHWEFSTPVQEKKIYKTAGNGMGGRSLDLFAENTPESEQKKIYKTAGDGMGGRNDGGKHWWDFGDENEHEDTAPPAASRGRARPRQQKDVEF